MTILLTAFASAILTSLFTLAAAAIVVRQRVQPMLQQQLDTKLAELGDVIEARVRAGVVSGVEELAHPDTLHKQMSKGSDTILNALFGRRRSGDG